MGSVGAEQGWDLRGRFDEYIGHVPLEGRTVLDVGAASGFLSFEAEQRGAMVTSFDAGSIEDRDDRDLDNLDAIEEIRMMLAGYDIAHHAFNSKAKIARGSVYRLSKLVPQHEVVIVGQILVHLKDPFSALREAAACCSDTLIIVEGSFDAPMPYAYFAGDVAATSYWHLSNAMYRDWLGRFGFAIVQESKAFYTCNHSQSLPQHEVWTFVARRKELIPEPPPIIEEIIEELPPEPIPLYARILLSAAHRLERMAGTAGGDVKGNRSDCCPTIDDQPEDQYAMFLKYGPPRRPRE